MNDALTKKNVAILGVCQALFNSSMSILIALGALVGFSLVDDKAFATLPVTSVVTGTALATIPASLLMRRIGRRNGFLVGALIGFAGSLVACLGIVAQQFWTFTAGTMLVGMFAAFGNYYRFAAADSASEKFRGKAISLVLAGGVVAGFAGPEIAKWTKDLLLPFTFLGCYVAVAGLMVATALLLLFLQTPPMAAEQAGQAARPLPTIMLKPTFIVAAMSGMIGYGVMSLIMTATPLAMIAHGHPFDSAATVIQWHVVAMFGPSFVTGPLVSRFGALRIIVAGACLNLICVGAAVGGMDVANFWFALVLLGVGWNFMFIGATTMVTEVHSTSERAKTQAANDFLIFGAVATASLMSGQVLHNFGWNAVAYVAVPFLLLSIAGAVWLALHRRPVGHTA
ncbi:MAG: MFS transporter [Minwuiales bacterium]|nr:MFS transporter [Minwuiales bacterium]